MKVILREDVPKLGKKGEVKDVAEGYARNMLFPRALAEEATNDRLKDIQRRDDAEQKKNKRLEAQSQAKADQLDQMVLTLHLAAGEGGRLFGSVTAADIADALAKQGYEVDKKKIVLPDPIKILGRHQVTIKLYQGIKVQVWVEVDKEK